MTGRQLPDLFETCYEGDHRKLSVAEFHAEWCAKCIHTGCRNSKGSELKWVRRILTQEDLLLNNPRFAKENDPRFAEIREKDFEDMVRKALAIEVSTRRGDWSVPSEADIGVAAAELLGLTSPPSGFKAAPEPPSLPNPPPKAAEAPSLRVAQSWKIRGDSGTVYEVALSSEGVWSCTCPSRENPCKHVRDIEARLARAAPPAPKTFEDPVRPSPTTPAPFSPRARNTEAPAAGIVIGGKVETVVPPSIPDPWAAPPVKPNERVISVGGKVSFGSGNKKA